ncbi:MAG: helix-turn-helix transcriptional regulator [Spirochaetia bacterium]
MVDKKRARKPARIQELLARNIKEARGRLKFTQEMLAERSDLTTSFIGEVEICRKYPRPKTLQKIADALGLKPYQLFVEEGSGKELERHKLLARIFLELKGNINRELEATLMKYSKD